MFSGWISREPIEPIRCLHSALPIIRVCFHCKMVGKPWWWGAGYCTMQKQHFLIIMSRQKRLLCSATYLSSAPASEEDGGAFGDRWTAWKSDCTNLWWKKNSANGSQNRNVKVQCAPVESWVVDDLDYTLSVAIGTSVGAECHEYILMIGSISLCAVSGTTDPAIAQNEATTKVDVLPIAQWHHPRESMWICVVATNDVIVTIDIGFERRYKKNPGQQTEHNFETSHIASFAITETIESIPWLWLIWFINNFITLTNWWSKNDQNNIERNGYQLEESD